MQRKRIFVIICCVLISVSMGLSYINQPDTFILYKDRSTKIEGVSKLLAPDNSIETLKGAIVPRETGDYEASLSIFGIPYKAVKVHVLEDEEVIACGQTIGIRLYADSLIVVAVGRVSENEKSPAEEAGIKAGDCIVTINGEKAGSPEEFSEKIKNSTGEVILGVERDGDIRDVVIVPKESEIDRIKRVGLWVRDSTAGVGTLTYADKDGKTYGALGHGVSDLDTGVKFSVKKGSIEECAIGEIKKGEKGEPGELKGLFFSGAKNIGDITKNEKEGIFGNVTGEIKGERVKLGHKSEVTIGKAYIRTSLDGKNVEDYEIEILKVSRNIKNVSKGLVIKVTDERLLEKTGGIVQGMSGSPIMQKGKLIGAVTHVLVNDPTRGYGIFIENMIEAGA